MFFFPQKSQDIFVQFNQLADLVHIVGQELDCKTLTPKTIARSATVIREKELLADDICHALRNHAEQAFLTPFDRDDMHALALQLDSVIDLVEDASARLTLYNGNFKDTPERKKFTRFILEATTEISHIIPLLEHKEKESSHIKTHIRNIHTIEHQGDQLYRQALRELFHSKHTAISVIMRKDLYEGYERILDTCETTADLLEVIIVKMY